MEETRTYKVLGMETFPTQQFGTVRLDGNMAEY
jgi:hypothetical protein